MKKARLLFILMVISILVCSMTLSVAADDKGMTVDPTKKAELMLPACPECGATMGYHTEYGPWVLIGSNQCPTFPNCTIYDYERTATRCYDCSHCGYIDEYTYMQYKSLHSLIH